MHLQFFILDFSYLRFIAYRSLRSVAETFCIFYCFLPKLDSLESLEPERFGRMDFRLRAVNNIQSLYYRMYSHSQKQNKPGSKLTIFQIAESVKDQQEGRNEAMQIMTAYRKVQDIRIPANTSTNQIKKNKQTKLEHRKPQSQYANKVKQTLRELNANRKKELESNKEIPKPVIDEKIKGLGSAERHLIQSGLRKLHKLLNKKYDENIKFSMQKIMIAGNSTNKQIQETIRLWKLRRVFSGWQYEAMLCKIQKQRILKEEADKQKRLTRLAGDFCYFRTVKKFFKAWSYETKKALKKKQFQLEQSLKRQEEIKKMEQQKEHGGYNQKKREVQANVELQNKLRGFLDGLKQQIEGKDRLVTIKQKTQESDVRREVSQSRIEREQNSEVNQNLNPNPQQANQQQVVLSQNVMEQEHHHGPLTSQQLEKKRKQLQKKARQRKQALEKLKKDRQQKKKQELQQKMALQKEIQQQQKRIKQEQYKKFVKQRRQEQEWKQKQKHLERQAIEFDRLRLMRFYGWQYWIKLKKENQNRAQAVAELLNRIIMKRKLETFVARLIETGQLKLKEVETKYYNFYLKKLKKKCLLKLKQWKSEQLDLKDELEARHQVNMIKIYFRQWQRTRNQIQLENYEWERPRVKRAQCLHAMTLMNKAMQGLKIHRDQEIQNRNIEQHKAKIKQKVQKIVEEKPTINYDDFL